MTQDPPRTKTIYLNGVIVGEYEATGDNETDIRLMREFLKSKGLYRETTLAEASFRHALSFATTAAYLHKRDLLQAPRGGLSVVPFVVNSAFSIELYLKTLYFIAGEKTHGHRLLELYDGLPTDMQSEVVEAAKLHGDSYATSIGGADDFRKFIEQLNDAYVDWRYSHETGTTGAVQIWPMILVMKALDVTCRARGGFTTTAESNPQPIG